ncbi:NUDIX hydrolase, partial [Candidatus Peregrinibacteria bacterium]|nr:NUDIX hydrolase [Candidatus Peregrinibacteria bacterium]
MKELFSGHGWTITEESAVMPNGVTKTVARGKTSDSAAILAFDDDGKILLLREYRPFWNDYIWMLPIGKIDKEADPLLAAQRELREETGFRADVLEPYFVCYWIERVNIKTHIFTAHNLCRDPLPQDAHECIEVHHFHVDEAIDKVLSSSRVHGV